MNTLPEEIQKIIDKMKDIDPTDEVYGELIDHIDKLVSIYDVIDQIENGGGKQIFLVNGGM